MQKITDCFSLLDGHFFLLVLIAAVRLASYAKVLRDCFLSNASGLTHFFKRLHPSPFDSFEDN